MAFIVLESFMILVVVALSSWAWLAWYRRKELEHPRGRSVHWIYRYFIAGILSTFPTIPLGFVVDLLFFENPDGFLAMIFGAGLPDEGLKFIAFLLLSRKERLQNPFNAVARGTLVGLGIEAFESVVYGWNYGLGVEFHKVVHTRDPRHGWPES